MILLIDTSGQPLEATVLPISRKQFPIKLPGAVSRYKTERDATFRVRLQGSYRKSAAPHKVAFLFQ